MFARPPATCKQIWVFVNAFIPPNTCKVLWPWVGFDVVQLRGWYSCDHLASTRNERRLWARPRCFKRRMLPKRQQLHLIRVQKLPTMLESDLSKLYPTQRRSCELKMFLFFSLFHASNLAEALSFLFPYHDLHYLDALEEGVIFRAQYWKASSLEEIQVFFLGTYYFA